ncbi:MAG TPA: cation:proton antiporter [Candidatus Limnocylindrales bacterium]|nr:cation:proton antiporter [Candidatus Limnocylindrales bacterium]
MVAPLTLIALVVLAYAILSRRLSSTAVTAPIFFAAAGFITGPVLGIVSFGARDEILVGLLEAALVMVLFADSSGLNVRRWTGEVSLSGRLLGIGLPLTMLLGAVVAYLLFPGIAPWQAALVGAILAPTDAALGQAVVANPRVPAVVRNALNVESGLNDGLVLPFVTIFLALGLVASGMESDLKAIETLLLALVGSTVVGLVLGVGGGWLVRTAAERGLGDGRWIPIALVAVAAASFSVADEMGASGFLAVWVAGLSAGTMVRGRVDDAVFHLPEQTADALAAVGFLLLGAGLLAPVLARATPTTVLYAVLSLTVIRILPVAIAMVRTGFSPASVFYIGWFGPRGLASIVFAGLVVEAGVPGADLMTDAILLTVAISLVAHGVTAAWGARRYASWFERAAAADPAPPEAVEVKATMRGRRSTGSTRTSTGPGA